MTDSEIITQLATGIHGWTIVFAKDYAETEHAHAYKDGQWQGTLNPLESWADVMELQAVVLADKRMADEYLYRLNDMACRGRAIVSQAGLLRFFASATPRQRCLAMIAVLEGK